MCNYAETSGLSKILQEDRAEELEMGYTELHLDILPPPTCQSSGPMLISSVDIGSWNSKNLKVIMH